MKLKPIILLSLFPIINSYANIDPSQLIKVTPKNNPTCVEYYEYKNAMYCSTKALAEQKIDSHIKDYETQKIIFDERPWQAVWGEENEGVTAVEYVPLGGNINSWKELVTSQFFPGLQDQATPKVFAELMLKGIRESGFRPIVTFYEKKPNVVIFEFRIIAPKNQIQDELQKITKTENGLYVLHYVIKEADMGQERRKQWLDNLSASGIK